MTEQKRVKGRVRAEPRSLVLARLGRFFGRMMHGSRPRSVHQSQRRARVGKAAFSRPEIKAIWNVAPLGSRANRDEGWPGELVW